MLSGVEPTGEREHGMYVSRDLFPSILEWVSSKTNTPDRARHYGEIMATRECIETSKRLELERENDVNGLKQALLDARSMTLERTPFPNPPICQN